MRYLFITILVATIGWWKPSFAQTGTASSVRSTYPAEFFAEIHAQSALDMLAHLPGFTFVENDTLRGFGDAAGNVLVDGARPTTKDTSLSEVLMRIPAKTVERIDVLDGVVTGLQGGSSRLVANVILKVSTGSSGTLRLASQTLFGDKFAPFAAGSWKGSLGGANLSASLEGGVDMLTQLNGQQRLVDSSGALIEAGPLVDRRRFISHSGSLSVAGPIAGISTMLATSLRSQSFRRRHQFDAFPSGAEASTRTQLEYESYPSRSAEMSLELKRTIGIGEAKLIGLQTWTNDKSFSLAEAQFAYGASEQSIFKSINNQSEKILRTTWGPRWEKLAVDVAIEGVRTNLRADTAYIQTNDSGTPPPDTERTSLTETRGSAALSATYTGIASVSIEGALAVEASRISLAEPFQIANTYRFFKPRLVMTWNPNSLTTLTLRAERKVSQLNFSDFVGAQQVADGTATQTNGALQPSQTDGLRLTAERSWGERGSLSVTLVKEHITNVVDVVAVGDGEGVGNLPLASSVGVDFLATIPVGFLVRGAELTINSAWRKTSVRDPFNGATRPLNGTEFANTTIRYRHIVTPRITYGGSFTYAPPNRYFSRQVSRTFMRGTDFSIYSEWNIRPSTKLRVEVKQLFGTQVDRELTRYNGGREQNSIKNIEFRNRIDNRTFTVQIEKSF